MKILIIPKINTKKLYIKRIKNNKNKLEENHKNYSDDKRYKTPNKNLNHINDNLNMKEINNSTISKYNNFSDSILK